MEPIIAKHIEMRCSAIHGQKACIAGTRIRVEDVYIWHEVQGKSPHEIVATFPQLSLADVHAALTYYWDNREEIQEQMKKGQEVAARVRQDNPPKLSGKLAGKAADADSVPS